MFKSVTVACSVLLLTVLLAACSSGADSPTPTAKPPAPTPTTAAAQTWPTPLPVPTATAVSGRLMVANTGGQGVIIRKTPGGDAIRGWMDGAVMQVAGSDQQTAGRTWRNVKDPAGNVGWIAAEFLTSAPAAAATAAPASTATPRP